VDGSGNVIAKPIVFGGDEEDLFLVLYCTGVRGRRVTVQLGDLAVVAVNIKLPRTLAGKGDVNVRVEVDGLRSSSGSLTFR
jgi:hypothetical protein